MHRYVCLYSENFNEIVVDREIETLLSVIGITYNIHFYTTYYYLIQINHNKLNAQWSK